MHAARTLFDAAIDGNIEEIRALLEAGANPDDLKDNVPAIYQAVRFSHEAAAMVLLEVTAPKLLTKQHSYYGTTMLHEAFEQDMANLIKAALERGAGPDDLNKHNTTALRHAIRLGHEATAMVFLETTDVRLLNIKYSAYGITLLHEAASKSSENFVKAALARGADPDILDGRNVPAIWYAVSSGHEALAMALLKKTDPKLLNNKNTTTGTTALHHAADKGMWGFIKSSVATKCIDPDAHSLDGKSWFDLIKDLSLGDMEKQALLKDIMDEHAWGRRGHLVMLRHRLRQARDAEMDAKEAAEAAQAPSAAPDA